MPLPPCPARFAARKAAILAQLAQPDDAYADASPKGAVDAGVRPLLAVINGIDGFVTTSSCAGRAAVFLEGRRQRQRRPAPGTETETAATATAAATTTTASSGGKGGGGTWLFVSHEPLVAGAGDDGAGGLPPFSAYRATDWAAAFGLGGGAAAAAAGDAPGDDIQNPDDEPSPRLVHLKFEPMILHVLTASLAHAQLLLRCAAAAGFRESGAVSIHHEGSVAARDDDAALPIVAVRSMGLGFSSVIGMVREGDEDDGDDGDGANGDAGAARCVVSREYLAQMARVVDERFAVNRQRTERFRAALVDAVAQEAAGGASGNGSSSSSSSSSSRNGAWEDAEARRARKRAEGLRQQAALRARRSGAGNDTEADKDALLVSGLE